MKSALRRTASVTAAVVCAILGVTLAPAEATSGTAASLCAPALVANPTPEEQETIRRLHLFQSVRSHGARAAPRRG